MEQDPNRPSQSLGDRLTSPAAFVVYGFVFIIVSAVTQWLPKSLWHNVLDLITAAGTIFSFLLAWWSGQR